MNRILESELMEGEGQALAYAQADFHEPNSLFVQIFKEKIGDVTGQVLDLGCGPASLSLQFARAYPNCIIYALDGSRPMLMQAQKKLQEASSEKGRVILIHDEIKSVSLPQRHYQVVMSNSLLHHMHDPMSLWKAVKKFAASNAWVFMMDLIRPASEDQAIELVQQYSADASEVLKQDYLNSLKASFREGEVKEQLKEAGLDHFQIEVVSEQHFVVYGRM